MAAIAKLELANLSEFQEELHVPKKEDKYEIDTYFHNHDYTHTWYSKSKVPFDVTYTEENVKYTPPDGISFILSTYLRHHLPEISVKSAHRETCEIAWSPYPAYASVVNASLKHDSGEVTSFPHHEYNIRHQYFRKPGFSTGFYNKRCGHLPELINWTEHLPSYWCNVKQPFFYNRSIPDSLPVGLNTSASGTNTCKHIYKFRRNVSDILRMRIKENDEWKEVPVDFSMLDGPTALSIPQMWGNVTINTNEEMDRYRCDKDGIRRYYEDVIHVTSNNTEELGGRIAAALTTCSMPCRYIAWMCENVNATNNRCFNNYTTSDTDISEGYNPMNETSMPYSGKNKRMDEMQNDHFLDEAEQFFQSEPVDDGYNILSFGTNIDQRVDVGVILGAVNASIIVNLKNKYLSDDKFMLHALIYVTRKACHKKDDSGKFICTIESE